MKPIIYLQFYHTALIENKKLNPTLSQLEENDASLANYSTTQTNITNTAILGKNKMIKQDQHKIFNPKPDFQQYTGRYIDQFMVFLDSGAASSITGKTQERAYRSVVSDHQRLRKSSTIFRFGSTLSRRKERTTIRIPLPDGQTLHFNAGIIDRDIFLLLQLDVIRKNGLVIYFLIGKVKSNDYNWFLPI